MTPAAAHPEPTPAAVAASGWRSLGLAVALYLALALAATWPLARHLDDGLPLGTDTSATVPLSCTARCAPSRR